MGVRPRPIRRLYSWRESQPSRFVRRVGVSAKGAVGGSPLLQQGELDFSPAEKSCPKHRL